MTGTVDANTRNVVVPLQPPGVAVGALTALLFGDERNSRDIDLYLLQNGATSDAYSYGNCATEGFAYTLCNAALADYFSLRVTLYCRLSCVGLSSGFRVRSSRPHW